MDARSNPAQINPLGSLGKIYTKYIITYSKLFNFFFFLLVSCDTVSLGVFFLNLELTWIVVLNVGVFTPRVVSKSIKFVNFVCPSNFLDSGRLQV